MRHTLSALFLLVGVSTFAAPDHLTLPEDSTLPRIERALETLPLTRVQSLDARSILEDLRERLSTIALQQRRLSKRENAPLTPERLQQISDLQTTLRLQAKSTTQTAGKMLRSVMGEELWRHFVSLLVSPVSQRPTDTRQATRSSQAPRADQELELRPLDPLLDSALMFPDQP